MNSDRPSESRRPIVLRAAHLFDATGNDLIDEGVVVIEDKRIVAAGTADEVAVPAGAEVIDLPGHTLMPGLIDAHTHLSQSGERRIFDMTPESAETRALKSARNLRRDLRAGVTTVRLVGTPDFSDIEVRNAVEAGDIPGPRILTATRALHATNGHGYGGGYDGPEELRKAVRTNFRRGADLIKFMGTGSVDWPGGHFCPGFTPDEISTIVEEAHRVGRRVATHSIQPAEVTTCVTLGVDSIEHGHMMDDSCIELMARHGTWLIGTLAIVLDEDIFAADLEINPAFRDIEWLPRRRKAPEVTRKVFAAGLRYACGTDAMHGGMAYEVRAHVDIGIPAKSALLAATRNAADACGLLHQVGTIELGKGADIIAVDGNPLSHVAALERVSLVMKAGGRYDDLSAM